MSEMMTAYPACPIDPPSIIAGGPWPFIATALFATFASSFPISLYILSCGVLGIIAAAMLSDYTNKDVSAEYQGV